MRRRVFIALLGSLASQRADQAQQAVARNGYLSTQSSPDSAVMFDALRQGLHGAVTWRGRTS
jgi:hypothetical protein